MSRFPSLRALSRLLSAPKYVNFIAHVLRYSETADSLAIYRKWRPKCHPRHYAYANSVRNLSKTFQQTNVLVLKRNAI